MEKQIIELLNSDMSSNKIANLSGVSQSVIHRVRTGERTLDGMSFGSVKKLYKLTEDMKTMNKRIKWIGKNTQGNMMWTAEGIGYKDLVGTIDEKYGYDYILDANAKQIRMLEINNEDLNEYDITSDGIGNWEKYEEFENRTGLKELSEQDYRDILESSKGKAYYQEFDFAHDVEFYIDGKKVNCTDGYTDELVDFVTGELNELDNADDYEDLILDLENKVKSFEDLKEMLDQNFNTKDIYFKFV